MITVASGDHGFYRLPVRPSHIHRYIAYLVAVSAFAQVARNRHFVSVIQHINDALLLYVGDHAARFDDVDFINAQPLRHFEFAGKAGILCVVCGAALT